MKAIREGHAALVERLRAANSPSVREMCTESADAIERLSVPPRSKTDAEYQEVWDRAARAERDCATMVQTLTLAQENGTRWCVKAQARGALLREARGYVESIGLIERINEEIGSEP